MDDRARSARAGEQFDAVKRPLHAIERRAENLLRQLFDGLWRALRRGQLAVAETGGRVLPNHLHRPVFARQERNAQRLLPLHDPLNRRLAGLWRDRAAHLDEAADVVRQIRRRNRRRRPQFPLRKRQRLEIYFPVLQPLFEKCRLSVGISFPSAV